MAGLGWLSNQDQFFARFRNPFTSTITCKWTPLEEQVTNTIFGQVW